jgi:hypothetical protein
MNSDSLRPSSATSPADGVHADRRVLGVVGPIVLIAAAIAYFWFIAHYGTDAIWYDQWSDVQIISHPTLSALWAQFHEGRLFFPNLVVLVLAWTTHFNIHAEAYVGGVMLVAAVGLMIWTHRRRSLVPWLYYLPFALVMLSFVQAQNSIWGFQMAWYLVMLGLAVAVFLLDSRTEHAAVFAGSIAAAVVCSYSSFQGLLVWPVGLMLLYCRKRSKQAMLVWIGAATLTTLLYFYHYSSSAAGGDRGYVFHHPLVGIQFFFVLVGETVGQQFPYGGHNDAVLVLGIAIVVLAVWTLCAYGFRQTDSGAPVGVAFVCFGLLFALLTTTGRASFTVWAASGSRYTTFDLLIPAGSYMVLLERAPKWKGWRIAQMLSVITIALLMVLGTSNGILQAREWHNLLKEAAIVSLRIDREPNSVVEAGLSPGDSTDVGYIRAEAKEAKARHLSVYNAHAPGP